MMFWFFASQSFLQKGDRNTALINLLLELFNINDMIWYLSVKNPQSWKIIFKQKCEWINEKLINLMDKMKGKR